VWNHQRPAQADALILINTARSLTPRRREEQWTPSSNPPRSAPPKIAAKPDCFRCLPQRFREELPKLLPEVDAFMGIDQVAQVADIVRQAVARRAERMGNIEHPTSNIQRRRGKSPGDLLNWKKDVRHPNTKMKKTIRGTGKYRKDENDCVAAPRQSAAISVRQGNIRRRSPETPLRFTNHLCSTLPRTPPSSLISDTHAIPLTPRHFAYVKIAEGCNHPCSFCIIPRMRGSHRSRQQADIVAEAKADCRWREGAET